MHRMRDPYDVHATFWDLACCVVLAWKKMTSSRSAYVSTTNGGSLPPTSRGHRQDATAAQPRYGWHSTSAETSREHRQDATVVATCGVALQQGPRVNETLVGERNIGGVDLLIDLVDLLIDLV